MGYIIHVIIPTCIMVFLALATHFLLGYAAFILSGPLMFIVLFLGYRYRVMLRRLIFKRAQRFLTLRIMIDTQNNNEPVDCYCLPFTEIVIVIIKGYDVFVFDW